VERLGEGNLSLKQRHNDLEIQDTKELLAFACGDSDAISELRACEVGSVREAAKSLRALKAIGFVRL